MTTVESDPLIAETPSPDSIDPRRSPETEEAIVAPLPVAPSPATPLGERLVSVDAYRGLAMILMASEGLRIGAVAATERFKNNKIWQTLAFHTEHVEWTGVALWDMIQPSFMFIVGVALPFSIAARTAKGQSFRRMFIHALWRSLLLIALGIFLRSTHRPQTYYTFEDVLTQIGLGYPFLFLLAWARPRWQALAAVLILVAYWGAFALYPTPPQGFDYSTVGVSQEWRAENGLHGFAAHWDKNTNLAAAADKWFLNLFPRQDHQRFEYNGGGYLTLNFVPSLGTMLFGLLCGNLLRSRLNAGWRFFLLVIAGGVGIAAGMALDRYGICPIVKRIWTPSWAIYAAGWTCLTLALFYLIVDVAKLRKWAFPLIVVGMNSIAIYCMAHLIDGFIRDSLRIHLGKNVFNAYGSAKIYEPMTAAAVTLIILWLICLWMYRRRIFLRI